LKWNSQDTDCEEFADKLPFEYQENRLLLQQNLALVVMLHRNVSDTDSGIKQKKIAFRINSPFTHTHTINLMKLLYPHSDKYVKVHLLTKLSI